MRVVLDQARERNSDQDGVSNPPPFDGVPGPD